MNVEGYLSTIEVDPVKIQQVLVNLVVDAQQAMPKGGTMTVGAGRTEDRLEFTVADQGSGTSPDVRSRIFEPFFSTKEGRTDGLGLAVCLGTVQRHGGAFDLESEVGKAATFRVLLPVSGESVERRGVQS